MACPEFLAQLRANITAESRIDHVTDFLRAVAHGCHYLVFLPGKRAYRNRENADARFRQFAGLLLTTRLVVQSEQYDVPRVGAQKQGLCGGLVRVAQNSDAEVRGFEPVANR